jgi:hypothetical protein
MTNILQIIILVTGVLYAALGLLFFLSPVLFGKLMATPVSDEWLFQIHMDGFLVLLYLFAKTMALLLIVCGLGMILPLFDPLKYRAYIYFCGVIFPLLATVFLGYAFFAKSFNIALPLGGAAFVILIINVTGLLLTKTAAASGIE